MDSQDWYYTLSTIAQTLAAILALGGTFVIFKLQTINERASVFKKRLFRIFTIFEDTLKKPVESMNPGEIDDLIQKTKKMLKESAKGLNNDKKNELTNIYREAVNRDLVYIGEDDGIFYLVEDVERLERDIQKINKVFKYLKWSLILLATTIIFSIFLLPGQKEIEFIKNTNILAFVIALAICSVCFQANIIFYLSYE